VEDAIAGRAKVTKSSNRYLNALTIDDNVSILSQVNTIRDTLHSLLDVTMKLGLQNISISKGIVNFIPWGVINKYLRKIFIHSIIIIKVCCNRIVTPTQSERTKIITENHSTAIEGHKAINKTLKGIKHGYSWPHMKKNIENFIRKCEDCQLKKLLRVKTRQPMILTDTPGYAFNKVAMDIVRLLQPTKAGHKYILTIQDLLTKFLCCYSSRTNNNHACCGCVYKKIFMHIRTPKGHINISRF